MIKIAKFEIADILTLAFNKSIGNGEFPQILKHSKIIPIFKADNKMLASNYRPISLLPIIGKILEKLMHSRLMSFFNKYEIINRNQYGFQKGKSTEHAIIDLQSRIVEAFERNEKPCCLFLDFAKAFDTVDHSILLNKLNHYGIRGTAHEWLTSYLSNRTQCVEIIILFLILILYLVGSRKEAY